MEENLPMSAVSARLPRLREGFVADLTDAAYPVALRHGARGSSVALELDVWKALDGVLPEERWERLLGPESPRACEELLAELSDVAYRVTLRHGFDGSFLDLELGLWEALGEASRAGRSAGTLACLRVGRGARNASAKRH
jgi:hypothetical protein